MPVKTESSFQRVLKAIEFNSPERVPRSSQKRPSDTLFVQFREVDTVATDTGTIDEWGCTWTNTAATTGHHGIVTGNPIGDWDDVETFPVPDPYAPGRFELIRDTLLRGDPGHERFRVGSLKLGPMHLLDHLLGFEEFMVWLVAYPERINVLLDRIERWLHGLVKQYAAGGLVDAVVMYDDQAMQTGPYFSMDIWRSLFKPRYRALCDLVHETGLKMMFHSCGNLANHLPELADCGIDLIDNKQPSLWMDAGVVDDLRGFLTFHTCVDMTEVFRMTAEEVEITVSAIVRRLGTPEGGFIGTVFNLDNPDIPAANVEAMWSAYSTFDWGNVR